MERLTYRDQDGFAMMKKRGGFKGGVVELLLRHVVLILPHADGLGVDLHKLGERILRDCAKDNCLMYCELKKVQEVAG